MPRTIFIPPHPMDNCARKTRYSTEIAARMGAQATLTFPGARHTQERAWVYSCPYCPGWHFTRRPNELPAVTRRQLSETQPATALANKGVGTCPVLTPGKAL